MVGHFFELNSCPLYLYEKYSDIYIRQEKNFFVYRPNFAKYWVKKTFSPPDECLPNQTALHIPCPSLPLLKKRNLKESHIISEGLTLSSDGKPLSTAHCEQKRMKSSPRRTFMSDLGSAFGPRGKSSVNMDTENTTSIKLEGGVKTVDLGKENDVTIAMNAKVTGGIGKGKSNENLANVLSPVRTALKDTSNTRKSSYTY